MKKMTRAKTTRRLLMVGDLLVEVPPVEDLDVEGLKARIDRVNASPLGQRLLREGQASPLPRVFQIFPPSERSLDDEEAMSDDRTT